jgi:phosphatidylserine decarboxylase
MSQPAKEWAAKAVQSQKDMGRAKEDHCHFLRDPGRPIFVDDDLVMAPADGIVYYQSYVTDMKESVLEVKGKHFTLPELMADEHWQMPSLVIGTFLTEYDVHIMRMPTAGVVSYWPVDPIGTTNLPMLAQQTDLLKGLVSPSAVDYIRQNERVIFEVNVPFYSYKYYIVAIADADVDQILPFSLKHDKHYSQGQRLAVVRWGSQVDLVMPVTKKFNIELMIEDMTHVEGCQDALLRIHSKGRDV